MCSPKEVDNEISGIALELLGKGKEPAAKLETEVTAVLIGYNVKNLADKRLSMAQIR